MTAGMSQFNMMKFGTKRYPWDAAMCLLQDKIFMACQLHLLFHQELWTGSQVSPAKDDCESKIQEIATVSGK